MAFVKFVRGVYANYQANTTHKDAIYFATDEQRIYLNGQPYGGGSDKVVTNVALNDQETGIIISFTEGANAELLFPVASSDNVSKKGLLSWSDLQSVKYTSALPDDLTTPNAVGGIGKGTTVADLKEKTLSQIVDDLLFPEVNPTITEPSASIALASGFSSNGVYEIGANAPVSGTNVKGTANLGKITVPGKADMNRAGEKTGETYYYGSTGTNETLPDKITAGTMQYRYKFDYSAGPQPLTSKGNNYGSPLAAGSKISAVVTIYGTYPYFSNGAQASTTNNELSSLPSTAVDNTKFTSLVRIDNNTQIAAKFASEAATGIKAKLYVPATKKVTSVKAMNALTGKFDVDFTEWEMLSNAVSQTVQGQTVSYKV